MEKTIGAVCRKLAKAVLLEEHADLSVTVKRLPDFLGPVKFLTPERKQKNAVGLVTGLACTKVGGEGLETDVAAGAGKGALILAGRLGVVMKEAATTAVT